MNQTNQRAVEQANGVSVLSLDLGLQGVVHPLRRAPFTTNRGGGMCRVWGSIKRVGGVWRCRVFGPRGVVDEFTMRRCDSHRKDGSRAQRRFATALRLAWTQEDRT
jgi:hypothetical protein